MPSLRKRILISAFILFHFGCVLAWVFPGSYRIKDWLLTRTVPLPTRLPDPVTHSTGWRIESQRAIASYLGRTGQWQHWNLFAPNPMPFNRYLAGRVTYRSGKWKEYTLPRVDQLGVVRAHLEARYREYQYGLSGSGAAVEDLARFFARSLNDPADPPVRVDLYSCQLDVPAHDRPGVRQAHEDYTQRLRAPELLVRQPLLEYIVKPEDLP